MKAIELLRVTPTAILARARHSTVVSFATSEERDQVGRPHAYILAGVVCAPPTGTGRLHMVQMRLYSPYGKQAPTWCVCDCEDDKFRWQTARTLKGSGSNTTSNGKLPNQTNPQFVFAVCKHMARALTRAVADAKVRKIIFGLPLEEIKHKGYPGRNEPRPRLTGRK